MRWLLLTLALGCASAEVEEACAKACDRPFAFEAAGAEQRKKVWMRFPEGAARDQAMAVFAVWEAEFETARSAWNASCLEGCVAAGDARAVDCRRRAQNATAWKECGP